MPGPYGVPQMSCGREGQGRAAAHPLCSGRVVAREWMATQGPSESPSHLTVTAPFDKGASLSPCGGSGALGGAQRAPPVCFANTLLRLIAPRGQSLCAPQFRCAQLWPHAHNPAPRRNSGSFLWFFLLLPKERTTSRGAAVPCSPPFPRRAKPDDACAKRGGQRFYGEAVPGLRQRRRGGSLHGPCASRRG